MLSSFSSRIQSPLSFYPCAPLLVRRVPDLCLILGVVHLVSVRFCSSVLSLLYGPLLSTFSLSFSVCVCMKEGLCTPFWLSDRWSGSNLGTIQSSVDRSISPFSFLFCWFPIWHEWTSLLFPLRTPLFFSFFPSLPFWYLLPVLLDSKPGMTLDGRH